QGHASRNAVLSPTATGVNNIGLFGTIGATGTVRNLNLTNFSVKANFKAGGPGQFVGVLAGQNAGTISNVNVSNSTVDGGNLTGVIAGGMVGQNGMFRPDHQQNAGTNSNSRRTRVTGT